MKIRITSKGITLFLQFILVIELVVALFRFQWFVAFLSAVIMVVTFLPIIFEKRYEILIPPEFHLAAVSFTFATLFLGEIRGYYEAYWWWDMMLHTLSGFLLGIFGFLLVYLMNETDKVEGKMKPAFVAVFSFMFALGIGALWEIFEYSMDCLAGTNMQKPMLNDPSGLTDTMWDLIVDAIGALIVSILGWRYLKKPTRGSFLQRWIQGFIDGNKKLFGIQQTMEDKSEP